jgi:hypothetical protein
MPSPFQPATVNTFLVIHQCITGDLRFREPLNLKFELSAGMTHSCERARQQERSRRAAHPVALELLFCILDLLLELLVFLILLACELLHSSLALNHLVPLRWRHLHNTCSSFKCQTFSVMHDSLCIIHHENNSLDKELCYQQRKHHAQAQAQTAWKTISENPEFSIIPARRGT